MNKDGSGDYIYTANEAAAVFFSKRSAQTHAPYLLPHIRSESAVLDVGCGSGQITIGFAETVRSGHVLGVDSDEDLLARARSIANETAVGNVNFQSASAYELPAADATFDVVHFHAVLSHLSEPDRALREAWRVLKPGGVLGAQEPDKDANICGGPFAESARRFDQLVIDDWRRGGGNPCLGRDLKDLAYRSGFTDVESGAVFDCSDSDGNRALDVFCLSRLGEPTFRERVLQAGLIDSATLEGLSRSFEARIREPSSFFAWAEVRVLARKP